MTTKTIDAASVAAAHDAMADEYDHIHDLWYSHLFNEIHRFMVGRLPPGEGRTALDVGCGTGFQSFLFARAGFRVHGFDISAALVERAVRKAPSIVAPEAPLLFSSSLPQVEADERLIMATADRVRASRPITVPTFRIADALDPAAYKDGPFDVITCCGSVLSFIDDYRTALALMRRALKPGGALFLEVEQRTNLDLIWPIVDVLLKGKLSYEQSLGDSIRNIFTAPGKNLHIDYPFEMSNGQEVDLPLWLFSTDYLAKAFQDLAFQDVGHVGIHAMTNLFPSTALHHQHPAGARVTLFNYLARVERRLADRWPVWRLGCSVLYQLRAISGQ